MTLKKRIAIYISLVFSVLFCLLSFIVYIQFSNFRQEESKDRLEEKVTNTIKLLLEVKEVDKQLLKLIDRNTINRLYNEKILIFNEKYELIYSSVDDEVIQYNISDLKELKKEGSSFKLQDQYDVFGMYYDSENADYYALISAEDKYGNRKLQYLRNLLLATFLSGTVLIWMLTFFFVKSLIQPLHDFQKKITNITENQLMLRLDETDKKDEINLMAKTFNQMMFRIEKSYLKQKEFTSNASHELRTPIARIISQLENLKDNTTHTETTKLYLQNIYNDANQMADIINSLILLAKYDNIDSFKHNDLKRLDEVVFDAMDAVKSTYPEISISFNLKNENSVDDHILEIECNESLLKLAFENLIKNAYNYGADQKVQIELELTSEKEIKIRTINSGKVLDVTEQENLFQPFMRGKNSQHISGLGLGLRITQRILNYHKAEIKYFINVNNCNTFEVIFHF